MTRLAAYRAFTSYPPESGRVIARWAYKYGRPSWTIETRGYVEEAERNHGLGYVTIVST